jgi:hypothetical protein
MPKAEIDGGSGAGTHDVDDATVCVMSPVALRSAEELAGVADPAWPGIAELIAGAASPVEVLEPDRSRDTLYRLQVTVRSALGALAWNAGGVLIDAGWLKLLGCGARDLPGLAEANGLGEPGPESGPPGLLTVAFDVLGGRFAVNGGALGAARGEVCYFGPDTLAWLPLGAGHGAFVSWALSGRTEEFYEDLRWPGWRAETAALTPGQGLSVYPPPWSAEGKDLAQSSRRPAAVTELAAFHEHTAAALAEARPPDDPESR